jgi:hypothetical protein
MKKVYLATIFVGLVSLCVLTGIAVQRQSHEQLYHIQRRDLIQFVLTAVDHAMHGDIAIHPVIAFGHYIRAHEILRTMKELYGTNGCLNTLEIDIGPIYERVTARCHELRGKLLSEHDMQIDVDPVLQLDSRTMV